MFGVKFDKTITLSDIAIIVTLIIFFVRLDARTSELEKQATNQNNINNATAASLSNLQLEQARQGVKLGSVKWPNERN